MTAPRVSVLLPYRRVGFRPCDMMRARIFRAVRAEWVRRLTLRLGVVIAPDGLDAPSFSLSAAFNRAADLATGDVLVTHPANLWPNPGAVRAAAERALDPGGPGWSYVYSGSLTLSLDETERLLYGAGLPDRPPDPAPHASGSMAVTRACWDAVGGYDERFGPRYGYEDCALRNALSHHYGDPEPPDPAASMVRLEHGETGGLARCHPDNTRLFWAEYAPLAPHLQEG